jgi:GNAT superfamily N-acetyltransferase
MGINITIRQAELADAPIIAEFNQRLAQETEDLRLEPDRISAGVVALLKDRAKGLYFLAEVNGEVVGQVMITYEWSDWRNGILWWLQSVYVKQAFRRLGIFSRLFEHVKSAATKNDGVRGIRLYMHADNTRARQSYERLGMEHTKYEVFEMALPGRGGVE